MLDNKKHFFYNKNMELNAKKYVLLFTIMIGCAICLMAVFYNPSKPSQDEEISVVKEITVSSSVQNVTLQTYNSKISGRIKNNTDHVLNNIVLRLQLKTNFLQHTGTVTINISTLNANAEYNIDKVFATTENFETVDKIEYQVDGSSFKTIDNLENSSSWWVPVIILVLFGVIFVGVMKSSRKAQKNEDKQVELNVQQDNYYTDQAKIEQQKLENKNKQIELELQRVNLSIKKAEIEQEKLKNDKPIYCSYCGSKNDPKDKKCYFCGSALK